MASHLTDSFEITNVWQRWNETTVLNRLFDFFFPSQFKTKSAPYFEESFLIASLMEMGVQYLYRLVWKTEKLKVSGRTSNDNLKQDRYTQKCWASHRSMSKLQYFLVKKVANSMQSFPIFWNSSKTLATPFESFRHFLSKVT